MIFSSVLFCFPEGAYMFVIWKAWLFEKTFTVNTLPFRSFAILSIYKCLDFSKIATPEVLVSLVVEWKSDWPSDHSFCQIC